MNTLATGWQAVSYGHATFSIYNFVSADAESHDPSTRAIEEPVSKHEAAANAPSGALPTLSEEVPAFS